MWPNPQETEDLATFTNEIPNGKLHFCALFLEMFPVLIVNPNITYFII